MTKRQLIELVIKQVNGGSETMDAWKKTHPLVVEKYINMAFNTIFYTTFRKDSSNFELYSKNYYDIAVIEDESTGEYYAILPIPPVQLPDKSDSVRNITLTDDELSVKFLPIGFNMSRALRRLGTTDRLKVITFSQNGERVNFHDHDPEIEKVNMFLVRSFESFADNENIPVPSGQDNNLFKEIINYFMAMRPDMKTIDSNPNT
jgi:hypothetical protein